MLKKLFVDAIVAVVLIALGVYVAFQLSPWPSALLTRYVFAKGAAEAAASIAHLVPPDVSAQTDISYVPGNPSALLDIFTPGDIKAPLPAVIWVHGDGFVAGSRTELSGYLKILAKRGFVVVAIDYTLAPSAQFPTPLRETNAALAFILAHAKEYNIDPLRIFLAGDSAGAQIAAQTALLISDPAYARKIGVTPGLPKEALRGAVLFCGPYDPSELNWSGSFAGFMRTVIWSYIGTRDPKDPRVAQIAVAPHVTSAYPPTFISAGNADPLEPQSMTLAKALQTQSVYVDELFFPPDHKPPLGHEYQLLLANDDGRLSFERFVAFLKARSAEEPASKPT
jgi:acetyl esterase